MALKTKIVLLTHPKEARRTKCGTGRLTRINIADCEIIVGVNFDTVPEYRRLLDDPAYYPVLVYPGQDAVNLNDAAAAAELAAKLQTGDGRRLVAFMIDATWPISRTVLQASASLRALPRLKFNPEQPSRFVIKRQPRGYCLSTLEAVHELLLALERAGADSYPDKRRLLEVFARMQAFQLDSQAKAGKPRYKPATVLPLSG